MPADSLTQTAIRDQYSDTELAEMAKEHDGYGRWGRTDYMLTEILDAIRRLQWVLISVNLSKGSPPPAPEPTPRPGLVTAEDRRRAYIEDQKQRFLMRQARRQQNST